VDGSDGAKSLGCGCRADSPCTEPLQSKPALNAPPTFAGTARYPQGLLLGLDVGSTTVKAVVVDPVTQAILWKDYQRHDTKQPEKCLEFLGAIETAFPDVPAHAFRAFSTGSGGSSIATHIGARFVQEVNAVALAVDRHYPDVQSVVELGGQDAKIIIFQTDPETGQRKKIPSMNDKCAGGTGAVIDKINAKLRIPAEQLCDMGYMGHKLHPVAGKCGVFAETDINGLQKQGVPPEELMASLFESIIQQNLSVLTRGHTLRPKVMLLGGPNSYIRGMQECWRHNIPQIWLERKIEVPADIPPEDLIIVPDNAAYFAALGAVEFALQEIEDDPNAGVYLGPSRLRWYLEVGRLEEKKAGGGQGLITRAGERAAFETQFRPEPWEPVRFASGTVVEAYLGIDGGSTSTKAALLDRDRRVIAMSYQLSRGNPIEDTQDVLRDLGTQIAAQGCSLRILGAATTGYAKDVLKDVIGADVALVETVAHTQSGLHYYPDADVICDVGGQDIKIIILKNGAVKDFKLNTQCSAGNGYFLQSTATGFGVDVEAYADAAFEAQAMPQFGYGCAVFMQSDIVDFQRQGWQAHEIMAGLANVLPKNIWLYVSQIPNLSKLGSTFILQGGTQKNLAAVKAQVDFITKRFHGTGIDPEIIVHRHCGESGAIGCALEAHRLIEECGQVTTFIGLDAVQRIGYRTTRNEDTRCYFCKNKCLRTFIDVTTSAPHEGIDVNTHMVKFGGNDAEHARLKPQAVKTKVPLHEGEQRLIIATCEKGTVEDVNDMRAIKKELDALRDRYPDLVDTAAHEVFRIAPCEDARDPLPRAPWILLPGVRRARHVRRERMLRRERVRIGLPRVLNMYSTAPFFLAYFQSLGVQEENLVWSNYTSETLYKEGAKRGSIDPCYPSKVCIPHIHNLLAYKHTKEKPLDYIFFPMIDALPTWLVGVDDSRACPTVTATPEATHAAFIKEMDIFAELGIAFKKTFVDLNKPDICARQMWEDWSEELGISPAESIRATEEGVRALERFQANQRAAGRRILEDLEREHRLGIVVLGRPYHNDPGISHEICAEFQKLGYPVLAQDALPIDADIMERLFGDEVRRGDFQHAFSIEDAWKNSYSENSSRKVWAAKYVARHPNLVGLELSSFKCGHDAPIYSVIEEIIECTGTPFFYFKDIDENKPSGSIKIRIETIAYFLSRYRETLLARKHKQDEIEARLDQYEGQLRHRLELERRGAVA
jgi:activator of 2-hydroxyglutaryl-CoA dehydratase/predicted nucleotide-binding protein (sugar kinase/HSP70/actin superfamily)